MVENKTNSQETNKKENVRNAICYIPFFAIILFFVEDKKSDELKKHIKYGVYLLVTYIILNGLLGNLFGLGGIISLLYLLISGFLGYKAYNGENVELEVVDDLEKKIKDKM